MDIQVEHFIPVHQDTYEEIDEDTYFFVKDDYELKDFGQHFLKGFEKSVKSLKNQ